MAHESVGLVYIVSQGNITSTIIWFAVTAGATAGLSYYKGRIALARAMRIFRSPKKGVGQKLLGIEFSVKMPVLLR